jgi:lactoylglutathione lyase
MKIEHIAIWARDIEKLKDFYSHYFHAVAGEKYFNPKKNFHSYFLSFETGCRLELMQMPGIFDNKAHAQVNQYFGLTHLAISVGSSELVDHLTTQLRDDGYVVVSEPRTTGDGYYESVILDPEGNRIEITA